MLAGYLYGVSKDGSADVPIWVPAGADGAASVPVTPLWADPFVGNTLTVRAKDRAGNIGGAVQYQFAANPATVPAPAKRGDITGDGRSDLVGISDSGDGQAQVRSFITAADGATVLGPTTPASMPAGGKTVTGDFNGDGHSDIAVFRDGANSLKGATRRFGVFVGVMRWSQVGLVGWYRAGCKVLWSCVGCVGLKDSSTSPARDVFRR